MLNALDSDRQAAVIGLMSCDSRDHFLRKVRAVAPHTGVITSMAVLSANEVYYSIDWWSGFSVAWAMPTKLLQGVTFDFWQ